MRSALPYSSRCMRCPSLSESAERMSKPAMPIIAVKSAYSIKSCPLSSAMTRRDRPCELCPDPHLTSPWGVLCTFAPIRSTERWTRAGHPALVRRSTTGALLSRSVKNLVTLGPMAVMAAIAPTVMIPTSRPYSIRS